jgi:hypothetical protein
MIYRVLSALQSSPYPITHNEQDYILKEYLRLIYSLKPTGTLERRRPGIQSSDFLGPASMTLQLENVAAASNAKNTVLENYVVTDKADGERKMLFACPLTVKDADVRLYLIDINMNITFTGITLPDKEKHYQYTLIDGEHVTLDKNDNPIQIYLAFDYYFGWSDEQKGVQSYCHYPFYKTKDKESEVETGKKEKSQKYEYRFEILKKCITEWNMKSSSSTSTSSTSSSLQIQNKEFVRHKSIFEASQKVLAKSEYTRYPTDGLIFTPSDLGIPIHSGTHAFKVTWEKSFKWKPPAFNTIDFFVAVRKNKENQDYIKLNYQSGINMTHAENDVPHKVIELHCGYDQQRHRFINPFATLLNDFTKNNIDNNHQFDDENRYTHQRFQPTCPFAADAYLAFVPLQRNEINEWVMKTTEGEVFNEGTIVEFAYDVSGEYPSNAWRWKPLRVRYDKTANLLAGQNEFGNAFHVADSIWHSLHFPLTRSIIESGENIQIENTEVYYEKTNSLTTERLRKFHNHIKRELIRAVGENGNKTIVDFAVGKAGDLSKWIQFGYSFVWGIDYARDNIMNSMDGACVRYLKQMATTKNVSLRGMFIVGDSSKNIRNGNAFDDKSEFQKVATAIVGGAPMNELGKFNGEGKSGFSVSSCQFAIHYFFKNAQSMHGFLRNVAENTKLGGYFIGTTFDGETVFRKLEALNRGGEFILSKDEKIYFKLVKKYDETGFPANETSLGYAIDVFQESIGQLIEEYLVNFTFLQEMMAVYGFQLIPDDTATRMGLPRNAGLFDLLYTSYSGAKLTDGEKTISMMNRFFVFQKTTDVNVENIYKQRQNEKQSPVYQAKPKFRKIRSGFIIQ